MNIGHLNIPKPEMGNVAFVHDIQTRLYLHYSRLLENEGSGEKVLKALEKDPRAQALVGQLISRGSGASRFEMKNLAMWFLWATNEFGSTVAEENLNRFLDSEIIPVINTLWVLGIEVDNPIELENRVRIISVEQMPDSRDKEQYLKDEYFFRQLHSPPMPKAAITYKCEITKIYRKNNSFSREKDKQFWDSSNLLDNVALLLNAIDGVSCIPYFSTSYSLMEMPMGMFGGTCGSGPLHEIWGSSSSKLSANSTFKINELLRAFYRLSPGNKMRMSRVLSRLSQAKRRKQIEDKILDLGIALEMALLEDNKNYDQLSLSFRLRGSWLIGSTNEERQIIYCKLKGNYSLPSA